MSLGVYPDVSLKGARNRRDEARGTLETAHRVLGICNRVFRYSIATGRAQMNPGESLKGALSSVKQGHFASATDPEKVVDILRMIDSYRGTLLVSCALRLAPLVFVRPRELRRAEWKDINFEKEPEIEG